MTRQQIKNPLQQMLIGTPARPPAGSMKLYPKADDDLYKLSPDGIETLVARAFILPDPLIRNYVTVRQTISLGYSNARLWSYGMQDPFNGGEALVGINALHVTPGAVHCPRLQSNGPAVVAGTLYSHVHTMPDGHSLLWQDGYSQILSAGRSTHFDQWSQWYWRSTSQGYAARMVLDYVGNLSVYGRMYAGASFASPGGVNANPSGQMFCTHLWTSADVQPGRPPYIAGQVGDNWLRWWGVNG